ncbi:MAG TPA: futalosine hydrolase [Trueperaceae bacterium]|nr:futalosine hydrolase [Trueperaceae bacterium]
MGATRFELAPLIDRLVDSRVAAHGPFGWPEVHAGSLAGVPVLITAGGVGKANTAAAVATVAAIAHVKAVLQVGIGGAYPGVAGSPPVPVGSVAVAVSEFDLDMGVGAAALWRGLESLGFASVATEPPTYNLFPCHPQLSRSVADAIGSPLVPFASSDSVSADKARARQIATAVGAAVESMEGAAAAQVCLALGLPFVELRAVSNEVGVRDKADWQIHGAIASAARAALAALPVVAV